MADGSSLSGLPSSNRGVSEFRKDDQGIRVGFDWIAFSVDLFQVATETGHEVACSARSLEEISTIPEVARSFASMVFGFFFDQMGFLLSEEVKGGRFYAYRVPIQDADGSFVGVIELGGTSTIRKDGTVSCRVELTGDGCRIFNRASEAHGDGHAKRWLALRAKLEATSGRLTRLDICADDVAGLYPVSLAQSWWASGEFDNRGQRPKARLYDDLGSRDGKTFYVGSASSERQLRVYEKGREMGDPDSEWVRYEAQFRASSRKELPLDMLRDPSAYLLGAYPVLRFIQACAERIAITKEGQKATWKSVRRHLKRQYGATLNFMVANTVSDSALARLVRSLTSERLPAWAQSNAGNLNWPDVVAINEIPMEGTPCF